MTGIMVISLVNTFHRYKELAQCYMYMDIMDWTTYFHLPEHPLFWRRVFHPSHTSWGIDARESLYKEKGEALDVLFLNNPNFLRSGVHVVRQYMEWCDLGETPCSYKLCDAQKAKAFLEHRLASASERWYEDKEAGVVKYNTPEECVVNAFRSAICHLDALAAWQGFPMQLLSEEPIKVLRDRITRSQNVARAEPRDYAASSRFLTKRLTQEEMEAITECWWDGRAAEHIASTTAGRERAQMRGMLFHCLQKAIGRRGADIRNLRLAMLFMHRLPQVRPVSVCPVIGASLRHVKEYSENVEHLLGWVRSKDRMSCPIGALAAYLVWMNDVAGIPVLEEIRRDLRMQQKERPWWKRMLFVTDVNVTDVNESPMSYATHYKAVQAGYHSNGIKGMTAATHAYRSTLACDQLESGASFLDVAVFQGWYHDNAADTYLRGAFKSSMMLRASGWEDGTDGYQCWWEGKDEDIPLELTSCVLSGLDDLCTEAERCYEDSRTDRSAVEFLKVLQYLRRVFLEDAVFKRTKYPAFPVYAMHPVFRLAEWPEYCSAEEHRIQMRKREHTRDTNHEHLCEMMKDVLADVLKDIPLAAPTKRSTRQSRGASPSNAPIELPQDTATSSLPEIPDPSCLYTSYQIWQQHRDYFYSNPQPPWKKRFGDRAATMKLRYSRMRPYFMYLDRCGAGARRVIDALDAFRKERKITASVFIKQCFYHLEHPLSATCKKPPPIKPTEMRERMEQDNLPPFN